jgi:hypothetical protein
MEAEASSFSWKTQVTVACNFMSGHVVVYHLGGMLLLYRSCAVLRLLIKGH